METGFILKLNRQITPHDRKISEKNIRCAETYIPRASCAFRPNLAKITSEIRPEQEMSKWANTQRAISPSKDPPYVRCLAPSRQSILGCHLRPNTPQPVPTGSTSQIQLNAQEPPTHPRVMSIQSFTLYQMRFALSADLCRAWDTFVGLSAQITHHSTVISL